jgi:hypothetical protein
VSSRFASLTPNLSDRWHNMPSFWHLLPSCPNPSEVVGAEVMEEPQRIRMAMNKNLISRRNFLAAASCVAGGASLLLVRSHASPIENSKPVFTRHNMIFHELPIECLRSYGKGAVNVVGHALVCNVECLKVGVHDVPSVVAGNAGWPARRRKVHLGFSCRRLSRQEHGELHGHRTRRWSGCRHVRCRIAPTTRTEGEGVAAGFDQGRS